MRKRPVKPKLASRQKTKPTGSRAFVPATLTAECIKENCFACDERASGQSLYGYGNQNPLRFVDPSGLSGVIAIPGSGIGTGIGTGVGSGIGTGVGGTLADPIVIPMVPTDYGVPLVEVEDPVTGAKQQCPRDCKGLFDQWKAHEKKLKEYMANPNLYDNKNFLAGASPEIKQQIINGRIKNLQKQIENFKNQYYNCLTKHGLFS